MSPAWGPYLLLICTQYSRIRFWFGALSFCTLFPNHLLTLLNPLPLNNPTYIARLLGAASAWSPIGVTYAEVKPPSTLISVPYVCYKLAVFG
jgi:hypothetical protein